MENNRRKSLSVHLSKVLSFVHLNEVSVVLCLTNVRGLKHLTHDSNAHHEVDIFSRKILSQVSKV